MSKHTPGPWQVVADPLHYDTLTTVIAGDKGINLREPPYELYVQVGGWADVERLGANTRLIAAAPDLLEAAEAVVARWDTPLWKDTEHTGVSIAKLRAAVAKAKGDNV